MANIVTNPTANQTISSYDLNPASANTTQSLGTSAALWNAALNSATTKNLNNVLNALEFAGSDIGAQVNAAIAALPSMGGTVYIPASSTPYTQTTTIVLPRYVKLCGASAFGTVLNYTPTTGWAIVMADSLAAGGFGPQGGVEDLTLSSSSSSNANGAIYIGGSDGFVGGAGTVNTSGNAVTYGTGTAFNTAWAGSVIIIAGIPYTISTVNSGTSITLATSAGIQTGASYAVVGSPSTIIDPDTYFGNDVNINRVRIFEAGSSGAFGVAIQWGDNAWGTCIFQSTISYCGIGLYFPSTITLSNSGERISIVSSFIGNNGIGLLVGNYTGSGMDFHVVNTSFDYNNSWAIQAATAAGTSLQVSLVGCHIEQPSNWIQNYGVMSLFGTQIINGTDFATLGYLIDNESQYFTMVGCEILSPTSIVFNPSGVSVTMVGNITNAGDPVNNYATNLDTSGNLWLTGRVQGGSFVGTTVNGGNPFSLASNGTFLGWNYSGGLGESDFFNNYSTGGGTATAFTFYANVSGTPTAVLSILANGTAVAAKVNATSSYEANGTAGVTAGPFSGITSIQSKFGIVTALADTSDERLKDWRPYDGGLANILQITPIRFSWNDRGAEITTFPKDREFVGFSAQDVQKALPEAVSDSVCSPGYLSFDDRPVIAALVNSVKELNLKIAELEKKLTGKLAHV
jgi:Chaperone of endosialidase